MKQRFGGALYRLGVVAAFACVVGGSVTARAQYVRDWDEDGVPDGVDNCKYDPNPDQADPDRDGLGSACDGCPDDPSILEDETDRDGDGVWDGCDLCPDTVEPTNADRDGDGLGDACDNCPTIRNPDQANLDGDLKGDACDPDDDGDQVCDNGGIVAGVCTLPGGGPGGKDNCRLWPNANQADADGDGIGDACELDADGDMVCDERGSPDPNYPYCKGAMDNCLGLANSQHDQDRDGVGDACDNCPLVPNNTGWYAQLDSDGDGVGDVCDHCIDVPNPLQRDPDGDGLGSACDNCPVTFNPGQEDFDGDGIGDACECLPPLWCDPGIDPECVPELRCDDGDTCTANACDPTVGCVFTMKDCDDHDACTLDDCDRQTLGCFHVDVVCDDGNQCTDDTCDPAVGCVFTNREGPCDDGSACTLGDLCIDGACVGQERDCTDPFQCTEDLCDPAFGCYHPDRVGPCDDGDKCTVDHCAEGACIGVPDACDDGDLCTDDSCDPEAGCVHAPRTCPVGGTVCTPNQCDPATGECALLPVEDGLLCLDGLFCTVGDRCVAGECTPTGPRDCGGLTTQCTTGVCDEDAEGCVADPVEDGLPCDDGDAFTKGDACLSGACAYDYVVACALPGQGCVDDGDRCNGVLWECDPETETCVQRDGPIVCYAPKDDCHEVACRPFDGLCIEAAVTDGRPCDDGDACTQETYCAPGGYCVGEPVTCRDGNGCTSDRCEPAVGCVFVPNQAACSDGNPCTQEICGGGACTVTATIPGCCVADADCAAPFTMCDAASNDCVDVQCRACVDDADCGPEANACRAMGSGSWCVAACDDGGACPDGAGCVVLRDEALCLPLAGDCVPPEPEPEPEPVPDVAEPMPDAGSGDAGESDANAADVPPDLPGTDEGVEADPGVEPIPEAAVEPVPEPVPEPAPEPLPESAPEPVPEPAPEPVPEPVPDAIQPDPGAADPGIADVPRDPGTPRPDAAAELVGVDVSPGGDASGSAGSGGGCAASRPAGRGVDVAAWLPFVLACGALWASRRRREREGTAWKRR